MAARWAIDRESGVRDADPEMGGLFNRDADNWRPLFAIADATGGHWPALAREAARALVSDCTADDESTGAMLLADIRAAFDTKGGDRVSSEDLVTYLHGCEGPALAGVWQGREAHLQSAACSSSQPVWHPPRQRPTCR